VIYIHNKKKLFKMKKTVPVLCIVFCLLIAVPSRLELSANAASKSVMVGPSDSIQAAINNATAGDTILVSAGVYNESLEINKTISLIGEDRDTTIINGQNSQFIVNITADNVTVQGFTIESTLSLPPTNGVDMFLSKYGTITDDIVENSQQGISLASSNNNTISNNVITDTQQGIVFTSSLYNTLSDNMITANSQGGISLAGSINNLFSGNIISNNNGGNGGIYMYASGGNMFWSNTVADNFPIGETISLYCSSNTFYDNNFYDTFQISNTLFSKSINTWDYGGQGNYWSNYTGHNRGDGIGDTPYTIDANNIDHYPLMGQFSSFTATFVSEPYQVSVVSNSTVSGGGFEVGPETGNEIIQLNVTGAEGTIGFSRIAIPTGLMSGTVIVLVGDEDHGERTLNASSVNYLYLTYSSRNETILVISSETLNLYDQLSTQFANLNTAYNELLSNYTAQFGMLNNDTSQLQFLNNYTTQLDSSLNGLLGNYTSLLEDYIQLQQKYQDLNSSYQQHLSDENQNQQNVRSLMYIFAAGTAVLIVATVYFSKRTYSRPKEASEKREAILSQPARVI
jgi:parallel beta-helix repeat protein